MFKMRSSDYKKRNLPDFRHKYSKTFYQEIVHVVDGSAGSKIRQWLQHYWVKDLH